MLCIGIDVGGTKTRGVLYDATNDTVQTASCAGGNIAVVGKEVFKANIKKLNEKLVGGQVSNVHWATFGVAGAGRALEKKMAREAISEIGFRNFSLMTDVELLHYTSFGEEQGILILSGTGSVSVIRKENEYVQFGGWGYLLGDEGSGYGIGRSAIRKALDEEQNGSTPTHLTRELLIFYQVHKPHELISMIHANSNPQKKIAACAKMVCELADKNEPNAVQIISSASEALWKLVRRAANRLKDQPSYKIAMAGGNLQEESILAEKIKELVSNSDISFQFIKRNLEPASGGVLHALKQIDSKIDDRLMTQLKEISFS